MSKLVIAVNLIIIIIMIIITTRPFNYIRLVSSIVV